MMYQLTVYPVMDRLNVLLTKCESTESGNAWTHLILETVDLGAIDADDTWDVIWLLGQLLVDRAMLRSEPRG